MYPRGVVYQRGKSPKSGEIRLHASLKTKILYNFVRGVGAGLIGFVIIAILFTFGPLIKQEVSYDLYHPSQVDLVNAQNTNTIQQEAKSFGVDSYFSIVIQKINARAN